MTYDVRDPDPASRFFKYTCIHCSDGKYLQQDIDEEV